MTDDHVRDYLLGDTDRGELLLRQRATRRRRGPRRRRPLLVVVMANVQLC